VTAYYLTLAAGGAGGGVFVTVLAPALFSDYWEYQSSILLALLVAGLVLTGRTAAMRRSWSAWLVPSWLAASLALGIALIAQIERYDADALDTRRSFYGVMRVYEEERRWTRRLAALAEERHLDAPVHVRALYSGEIMHGSQYLHPTLGRIPTTYYGWDTGAGVAIDYHPKRRANDGDTSLKIAAVGLGTGTLAAHLLPGDQLRFYEINPDVIALNEQYFTYLEDSSGTVEVELADGRIGLDADLARDGPASFDVIVLDAFSGDAIPVHLLTTEAFALYRRHLKPDGILAVHISNRYIDLKPVLRAAAEEMHFGAVMTISEEETGITEESDWAILTRNLDFLEDEHLLEISDEGLAPENESVLWTDDYSSLMGLFY
jgi:SAM-dependent methyltransferase